MKAVRDVGGGIWRRTEVVHPCRDWQARLTSEISMAWSWIECLTVRSPSTISHSQGLIDTKYYRLFVLVERYSDSLSFPHITWKSKMRTRVMPQLYDFCQLCNIQALFQWPNLSTSLFLYIYIYIYMRSYPSSSSSLLKQSLCCDILTLLLNQQWKVSTSQQLQSAKDTDV